LCDVELLTRRVGAWEVKGRRWRRLVLALVAVIASVAACRSQPEFLLGGTAAPPSHAPFTVEFTADPAPSPAVVRQVVLVFRSPERVELELMEPMLETAALPSDVFVVPAQCDVRPGDERPRCERRSGERRVVLTGEGDVYRHHLAFGVASAEAPVHVDARIRARWRVLGRDDRGAMEGPVAAHLWLRPFGGEVELDETQVGARSR
jgi:hypothetical protein